MREECGDLGIDMNPLFVGDRLRPFRIKIRHADQCGPRQGGVETRMVLTQMADSDDPGA